MGRSEIGGRRPAVPAEAGTSIGKLSAGLRASSADAPSDSRSVHHGSRQVHAIRPPVSRRAALSIRRLAILRGVRRIGAGGRSRKRTARIKQPKESFQWERVDFRQTWHLRNKDNGARVRAG